MAHDRSHPNPPPGGSKVYNPTPIEREVLEEAGWKPGDPIPNLADTAKAREIRKSLGLEDDQAVDFGGHFVAQERLAQ